MRQYLMCSGGKDSMASAILCYKKGVQLDGIVDDKEDFVKVELVEI